MTATQTFSYTGAAQSWVVPAGVSTVSISCLGAVGGAYNGSSKGGSVSGTLNVTPGETLWIYAGGSGAASSGNTGGAGGWNGGGAGGNASGAGAAGGGTGGGGASDVRQGGTALADRQCVAGGGSGRTTNVQGALGGASIGQTGPGAYGGTGGTQSAGGTASGGGGAGNGSLGDGGNGGGNSGSNNPHYGAGGGGGGYYGGAGGGMSAGTGVNQSSGGGGSNFVGGLTGTTTNVQGDAAATGNGSVTLTWNPPPNAPTIVKPASAANLDSTIPQTFSWTFSSADPSATLVSSQIQYRATANNAGYGAIDSFNLCPNPNFETDLSGWGPTGSPAPNVYRTTTRSHSGSASMEISSRGASSFLPGAYFTATGLTIGQVYTVSAYAYVPSGNPEVGIYAFGMSFGTSTGTLVDQWVRISYTFTATAASNGIGIWQNSTASGQIADIDDVLLEVGNALNPYFDGSSTAQIYPVTVTYAWTAGVNNSISTRTRAWNASTVGSGGTTKTYSASTFASQIEYEWEVNSTDNDALTGPYSAPRTFTASPPVTNMAAKGGMVNAPSLTVLAAQPLTAIANLTTAGLDTLKFATAIGAAGSLSIAGSDTINAIAPLAAVAALSATPSRTLPFSSVMAATTSMILAGFDTEPGTVNFAANVIMNVQVTLGVTPISVVGSMVVTPQFITKGGTLPMSAVAQLIATGFKAKSATVPMTSVAVLAVSAQTLRFPSIPMAVHGSLSQSGTVSRSLGLPVAARAVLSLQGLLQLSKPQPLVARGALVVVGARNAIVSTSLAAHGSMVIVPIGDQLFSIVPLAAVAQLVSTSADTILIVNHMQAVASLTLQSGQSIIGHTYLVVPSVNGSVLTFTASGYPNPKNTPSASSVGNVAP